MVQKTGVSDKLVILHCKLLLQQLLNLAVIIRNLFHLPVLENHEQLPNSSKTFLYKLFICPLWVSRLLGARKVVSMAVLA